MNRIDAVATIMYDQMTSMGVQPTVNDIARALDAAGHLMPDLPKPTNNDPDYAPVWQYGLIEAEGNPDGSVLIDTGNYQSPLLLNRLQVLMILAASESRGERP